MTLMSAGLAKVRYLCEAARELQATIGPERRTLESWERQIAYCQKYAALLSRRDEQFVNDLAGREPTPSRIKYLNAITAAIQRDPRSSGG
jgi:hypothetical protein